MQGYHRLPLLILAVLIASNILIFRYKRPTNVDVSLAKRQKQRSIVKTCRFLGYGYAAGLILWLFDRGYEGLPLWLLPLLLGWSVFLIWLSFSFARRFEQMPADEWERRLHR